MTTTLRGTIAEVWVDHTGRIDFPDRDLDPTATATPSIDVSDDSGARIASIWVADLDAALALADAAASMLEYHHAKAGARLAAVRPPVTAAGKQASVQAIEGRWS